MSLLLLFRAGGSPVGAVSETVLVGAVFEPLDLYVEVRKPDGRSYRWDGDGDSEDVPVGISVTTKRMEGFANCSLTLSRRIDHDHPDIELRDEIGVFSASGETVWEGRVAAAPRSLDESHSISVEAVGWMASARDQKLMEIFVDRAFDGWGERSTAYRAANLAAGWILDADYSSQSDRTLGFTGSAGASIPINSETDLYYRAPDGVDIAKAMYKGTEQNTANVVAALLYSSAASSGFSTSVALTLDDTVRTATLTAHQHLLLEARASATHTPGAAAPFARTFTQLALYGNHGLTTRAITGEPDGVYASDVMEHIINTYCPKLSWGGNGSTYPIPHLVFDSLTDPYDALLACNAFHLLDLACWENRTVHWYPVDLNDWDWELRLDDPGVSIDHEGDSDEDLANGIVVQFTELQTGDQRVLYPTDYPELRDDDELNPANRHGDEDWTEVTLSNPSTQDAALQMGRVYLAEFNQPKRPGTYTVNGGYLRDRQGNWQPGWKVRATDTIAITDHPSSAPRLITETSWSADSHSLTIATDSSIRRIDAFVDRLSAAIGAHNLSR